MQLLTIYLKFAIYLNKKYMLIFKKQVDLAAHLKAIASPKTTIGFVPTMGALHAGHLSLLAESFKNNDITVISIFVNPTQFNNPDDLEKYPRTLEADLEKIESVSANILVFTPSVSDIYEGNTKSTHFKFGGLENQMEGKFRPGHFDGVGTIVKRLFEIVQPTNAYFGEKDFQQLQIIKKMVTQINMPVNVVACPIYRAESGLAMSSRNERLSVEEKEEAAQIYKVLLSARFQFKVKSAKEVSNWVQKTIGKNPDFKLEYFEIAEEESLLSCRRKNKNKKYRAFIAVFLNNVRLIDTIALN